MSLISSCQWFFIIAVSSILFDFTLVSWYALATTVSWHRCYNYFNCLWCLLLLDTSIETKTQCIETQLFSIFNPIPRRANTDDINMLIVAYDGKISPLNHHNGISQEFNAQNKLMMIFGPRQANLVLIAYASSEGSGEPAHPRSLARTFAARSYKQWVKRNLQTESQIPSPSEWLGMRS